MKCTAIDAKRVRKDSASDEERKMKKRPIITPNDSKEINNIKPLSQLSQTIEKALPSTAMIEAQLNSEINTTSGNSATGTSLLITQDILNLPSTQEINSIMKRNKTIQGITLEEPQYISKVSKGESTLTVHRL